VADNVDASPDCAACVGAAALRDEADQRPRPDPCTELIDCDDRTGVDGRSVIYENAYDVLSDRLRQDVLSSDLGWHWNRWSSFLVVVGKS
jgi:hypothetical protein